MALTICKAKNLVVLVLCLVYCHAKYTPDQCGRPPFPRGKRMIRGGEMVDFFEYPFIAGIRNFITKTTFKKCTAALISENYVLTAGHCCEDGINPQISFQVKDLGLADNYIAGKCTRHPNYVHSKSKVVNK